MTDFIILHESSIRLSAFLGGFILLALWEMNKPKRQLQQNKIKRWLANSILIVISTILVRFVVPATAISMAYFAEENNLGFIHNIEMAYWAKCVIAIVLLDMIIYLQHLNFHELPILWRLHRVHHSDKDCDVSTGVRFHPIEIAISIGIKIIAISIIGPPVLAVIIFEVILNVMSMFTHSNIRIPKKLDNILRYFMVTPDMHRIHHSVLENEANSNFSFSFSIWDRLFGTYTKDPESGHLNMKIGLDQFSEDKYQTPLGLLYLPFISKNVGYSINRRDSRQRTADTMQKLNQRLKTEIKKKNENEKNLIIATKKSEKANSAKSEFLSTMSHEIRTPMNGVIGMLELLKRSPLQSDQRRFVTTASQSAENLLDIINEILDFSKIEAGQLQLDKAPFYLIGLIEDSVTLLADAAHAKNIELICDIDINLPEYVLGDTTRLRQILINLLSNAIKFTENGEVIIRCHLLSSTDDKTFKIQFEVCDTGIGISKNSQEKLFNAFTQADSSTTRKFGGTGLGLAISQRLTQLMGGDIKIDSQEGKGSRFYFDLTLTRTSATDSDNVNTKQDFKSISDLRILVVDDNQTNLNVISGYLNNWGISHDTAMSAKLALKQCRTALDKNQLYHLALLDFHMPEMDGGQLAQILKADKDFSGIPLVLLSSVSMLNNEAQQLGFSACLDKPIYQSQLQDTLAQILQSEHATKKISATSTDVITLHGRVLIVDDHEVNRSMAEAILNKMGLSVSLADNGQNAIDVWKKGDFDLILMDVQMPVMNGYEATQEIRKQEAISMSGRIPIIAMTANAMEQDRRNCLNNGMDDHLPKPFKWLQMETILKKWLPDANNIPHSANNMQSTTVLNKDEILVLDMGVITELKELFGNAFESKVEQLLDTTLLDLQALKDAIKEKDADQLNSHAHHLKGSIGIFGGLQLMEACQLLEEYVSKKDWQAAQKNIETLPEMFEKFKLALNATVNSKSR